MPDIPSDEQPIPKIVLTGGPCAGKTTALSHLFDRLSSMGMKPIMVPEAATVVIGAGVSPGSVTTGEFQTGIMRAQLALENVFETYARQMPAGCRPVLICDRGSMDSKAFCDDATWKALLRELKTNEVELREGRYTAIIHMVTAADGAEHAYTLENNSARKETPEQARAQDRRLQEAWLSHPHLRVIDNSGDFAHKVHRVEEEVLGALGLPLPVEEERKFKLPVSAEKALLESGIYSECVDIEQTYLLSAPGETGRVRRRAQGDSSAYFHCIKRPLGPGKCIEIERKITEPEYEAFLAQRDPDSITVCKKRYCYLYKTQYQELDIYSAPNVDFAALEVETSDEVKIPPFFTDVVEVTGEKSYSNAAMAKRLELPGKTSAVPQQAGRANEKC